MSIIKPLSPPLLLMKDIIREGAPALHRRVAAVSLPPNEEDRQCMQLMMEYLRNSQDTTVASRYDLRAGVGMSANQIGLNKRMCAICIQKPELQVEYELYNPVLISHSDAMVFLAAGEGCLSVDRYVPGFVPRYEWVKVQAADAWGTLSEYTFHDYTSIVVQHELDHLDGVLFYDHISVPNPFQLPDHVSVRPIIM